MTKMKHRSWHSRDRQSKLASVLWPSLADRETRAEMDQIAKAEGRRSPTQREALLDHSTRGAVSQLGGTAINRKGK